MQNNDNITYDTQWLVKLAEPVECLEVSGTIGLKLKLNSASAGNSFQLQ